MADMHPEDIKAEIRKRGYNLTELAEINGLAKQSVSEAIRSRASAKAEKIIGDLLDMDPAEIWPSRYRADGTRIMLRRSPAAARKTRRKTAAAAA